MSVECSQGILRPPHRLYLCKGLRYDSNHKCGVSFRGICLFIIFLNPFSELCLRTLRWQKFLTNRSIRQHSSTSTSQMSTTHSSRFPNCNEMPVMTRFYNPPRKNVYLREWVESDSEEDEEEQEERYTKCCVTHRKRNCVLECLLLLIA